MSLTGSGSTGSSRQPRGTSTGCCAQRPSPAAARSQVVRQQRIGSSFVKALCAEPGRAGARCARPRLGIAAVRSPGRVGTSGTRPGTATRRLAAACMPKRSTVALGSRWYSGAYSKYRDLVRGTNTVLVAKVGHLGDDRRQLVVVKHSAAELRRFPQDVPLGDCHLQFGHPAGDRIVTYSVGDGFSARTIAVQHACRDVEQPRIRAGLRPVGAGRPESGR